MTSLTLTIPEGIAQRVMRAWLNSDDACGVSFSPSGRFDEPGDIWCGLAADHDGDHMAVDEVFGIRYLGPDLA